MGAPYQIVTRVESNLRCVALLEDRTLLEYYQENAEADGVVGTIFLGRVERVLPDEKAAFVKIGLRQNGFLPLKEAESYHQTSGNAPLMSGQEILVQAKKAPKGGKGAFDRLNLIDANNPAYLSKHDELANQAYRVLGVAYKRYDEKPTRFTEEILESQLEFAGFVGIDFLD